MKEITSNELWRLIKATYPNVRDIELTDTAWETFDDSLLSNVYNSFQRSMWRVKLTQWMKNKLDCDKWALLLVAHVIIRNALGKDDKARALGRLSYHIGADPKKAHMINVAVMDRGDYFELQEVEPQPKQGKVKLTDAERATAWRVSF